MNVIATCLVMAAMGLLCWLLIILSYWHPWILVLIVGGIGVGVGWVAIAYGERK